MHDTTTDHDLIDRREFVARGSLVLAALAVCGCADATAPRLTEAVSVSLADYPALAQVGGIVQVRGEAVALERTGATAFTAFSLRCPHKGAEVDVTGSSSVPFRCPRHGAEFNANGANVGGERTGSLERYSATYDATAGTVTIQP